ncbi:hypothetical protein SAMN05421733_103246 [Acinetobacter boissieri]|uniref:Uncharacterized protein n=1 Tax=Acinetobacter boissieri TaxID=1219383 RepID=A0A1G6H3A1_9GAMM|nr:hypothetical protein SAMN05421733_103246 [Acinetobacter boissieri]
MLKHQKQINLKMSVILQQVLNSIKLHTIINMGETGDPNVGSHGCMAKTGSPIHWHYDVNYQASDGQCFLKKHNFDGCGVAPL